MSRTLPRKCGIYLDVFPRRGRDETIVNSIPVPNLSLDEFRSLFDMKEKHDVIFCYDIEESHRHLMESRIGARLDLEKYAYQITATAEADDALGEHIHDIDWY